MTKVLENSAKALESLPGEHEQVKKLKLPLYIVLRVCLCKMRELRYYVRNTALFET